MYKSAKFQYTGQWPVSTNIGRYSGTIIEEFNSHALSCNPTIIQYTDSILIIKNKYTNINTNPRIAKANWGMQDVLMV